MRSFVAAEISEQARRQLQTLISGLRNLAGTVRWVKPEQMHLTLAFLGGVSADFIESCRGRLAEAVNGFGAFPARLEGIGAFPSAGRARVVWAGMDEGKEELKRLQAAVTRELVMVGFEPEKRQFSPHLTIGRLKIPADVRRACETQFESERFEIDRLVLFQSILRPQGPEYAKLGEWRLGK
jgi:2'-5' RNA ligase